MAKKRPEHHAEPVLESAMDYAQHETTYTMFVTGVKWIVILAAVTMVALYFIINP